MFCDVTTQTRTDYADKQGNNDAETSRLGQQECSENVRAKAGVFYTHRRAHDRLRYLGAKPLY